MTDTDIEELIERLAKIEAALDQLFRQNLAIVEALDRIYRLGGERLGQIEQEGTERLDEIERKIDRLAEEDAP